MILQHVQHKFGMLLQQRFELRVQIGRRRGLHRTDGQHAAGKQKKRQTYMAKKRHDYLLWRDYIFFTPT